MKQIIIPIAVTTAALVFNSIIGAEDNTKKLNPQPLLVETGPIIIPIPRPTPKVEFCTRSQSSSPKTEEVIDGPIPLHCLEPNCGLGVYRKKENDSVERCSYCEAIKPEKA